MQVYFVDPGTGYPTQSGPLNSPFGQAYVLQPIFATMAGNGGGQPSSGPMLSLNTISLNFGQATEGQATSPQAVTLSSIGNEAVSLASIVITGSSAGDFTETDTCMSAPLLAPKQSCSVSITYRPLGVGNRQATLSITDNSPGSPQSIALAGTSVAPPTPTPIASFTPAGTFNISGTVTVGMTSGPQNLVLTNTGNAAMHVTSIVFGGVNVNDFSRGTSTCVGTLAASSNCSIPIIFAPVAAGIRSSTITVTDDAPASLQVVAVNGTAAQPVSIGAVGNGSTSASVAAGQTAQFLLQANPGPGFTGTLSFVCAGQPFGAVCTVPTGVTVSGAAAIPFTISVSTLTASVVAPQARPPCGAIAATRSVATVGGGKFVGDPAGESAAVQPQALPESDASTERRERDTPNCAAGCVWDRLRRWRLAGNISAATGTTAVAAISDAQPAARGRNIGVYRRNSPELGDDRTGDGHRRKSHCKHSGERKLQIPNAGGLLHANGDSHRDRSGIKQVVAVERDLADSGCELAGARYVNLLTTDHS